nr:hypothetical protein [Tanacetum cinerariifolium]
QDAKRRIIRWILLLQEFDIEIKNKKGAENIATDHLSQLENPNLKELKDQDIDDNFPDETLINVSSNDEDEILWFAHFANYPMVNTRTDTDLTAAVQNALQALLPQISEEIREEFRTGSGSSNAGGNPTPVTIHTWLERFNKQKPNSFEKATVPVDAENWISHMEKIFDVMGCEDAFKTRLAVYKFEDFKKLFFLQFFPRAEQERLKREYHSIRQTSSETSTEFMQRFLRLAGFLGAAAGTEEEQAKNFQWGLRRSTLNHLMCMSYTDVAQVANAARNYEILHERDDQDSERPDKR